MRYPVSDEQRLTELVFKNRNRHYGAYALRVNYPVRLLRSLLYVAGVLALLAGWAGFKGTSAKVLKPNSAGQLKPDSIYKIVTVQLPEEEPEKKQTAQKEPEAQKQTENPKTTYSVSDLAKETDSVATEPVTRNLVDSSVVAGEPLTGQSGSDTSSAPGIGGDTTGNSGRIYSDFEVQAAEFPGGINALRKFVARRINYPPGAADAGEEGTVLIRFVVDEKGNVVMPEVEIGAYPLLDREALRVVSMLPPFSSPGMINGTPVKTYYKLPIRFSR